MDAVATPILQGLKHSFRSSQEMYAEGNSPSSNTNGGIYCEGPWWPHWALLVQHAEHSPTIVGIPVAAVLGREAVLIALEDAAELKGTFSHQGEGPAPFGVRFSVAARELAADKAALWRVPSATIAWATAVRHDGSFRLAELPIGCELDLEAFDRTGTVISNLKLPPVSPGDLRVIEWKLQGD